MLRTRKSSWLPCLMLAPLIVATPLFGQFGNNQQQRQYEAQQRAAQEQQRQATQRSYEQMAEQQRQLQQYQNRQRELTESQNRAQGFQQQQRQREYFQQQQDSFQQSQRRQQELQQQQFMQQQEQSRRQLEQQETWRRQAEQSLRNSQFISQNNFKNLNLNPVVNPKIEVPQVAQQFEAGVQKLELKQFPARGEIEDRFEARRPTLKFQPQIADRFQAALDRRRKL